MNEKNITTIKNRAKNIQTVTRIIFMIGIILFFAALVIAIFFFFASPDRFNAVKGNSSWQFSYSLTDHSSFFTGISFKILQPLDNSLFSAKSAAIASLLSLLMVLSVILYGIKQVAKILDSTANGLTPFIMANVQSLRRLALAIIIYSLVVNLLSNLVFSVFVTKIFYVNIANVHWSGLFIGGLILIIADIFNYGVFLQNEFDTTL